MVMYGKKIDDEALEEYIDYLVEDLFKEVAANFNIKHGDIDPMQNEDIIRFKNVIKKYIRQNSD